MPRWAAYGNDLWVFGMAKKGAVWSTDDYLWIYEGPTKPQPFVSWLPWFPHPLPKGWEVAVQDYRFITVGTPGLSDHAPPTDSRNPDAYRMVLHRWFRRFLPPIKEVPKPGGAYYPRIGTFYYSLVRPLDKREKESLAASWQLADRQQEAREDLRELGLGDLDLDHPGVLMDHLAGNARVYEFDGHLISLDQAWWVVDRRGGPAGWREVWVIDQAEGGSNVGVSGRVAHGRLLPARLHREADRLLGRCGVAPGGVEWRKSPATEPADGRPARRRGRGRPPSRKQTPPQSPPERGIPPTAEDLEGEGDSA